MKDKAGVATAGGLSRMEFHSLQAEGSGYRNLQN